jgi:hypothetical protein
MIASKWSESKREKGESSVIAVTVHMERKTDLEDDKAYS